MTQAEMIHEMYLEAWKRAAENLMPDEKPYTPINIRVLSDRETYYGRMLVVSWDYEELDGDEGDMPTIGTGWWYRDLHGNWLLHNLVVEYDLTAIGVKGFD